MGNNYEIYYAKKIALFEKALSLSKTVNDLIEFLAKKTKMRFITSFELGEVSPAPGRLPFRWLIKGVLHLAFILLLASVVSRLSRVWCFLFDDEHANGR